ncbi:OR33A protein, partial [Acromyrmex charruanus]
MEPSREHYYDISKRYLTLIGQWPYQKLKESLFFLILILVFDVSILVTQIKDLTDRLSIDWNMLETKTECDIMRRYAENGRWYVLIYSSYVYISTISFTTTSLMPRILDVIVPLNTSRPVMMPYPAYYFVDENRYFYYIFLHMIICSTICLTGLIAHDCMFFTYIEHICGLFAIVRFAKLLEDTFSISFAVQILLVTICLSITLVQVAKLIQCDGNTQCILLTIPALMLMIMILVKLYTCHFNRRKIKILTDHLVSDWEKLKSAEEYEIMKTYAANARLLSLAYCCKDKSLDDVYDRKIADSVYAHQRALWFAKLLENTFYIAFGIQIMIVTIAMSISLLQIVMQIEIAETMRYTAYVISQLVHLFCYSLQGQKLIDHSLQMRNKIYNCSWYNIPAKSQRLLLYVMQRSMQPNFLSAGKIYVFSLKSFTTVVKSSVSYFTVLASFHMEHNRDYYYDISKWYLMLVGQWPYQKLKESLSFLIFILFLDASALVTQIAKFVVCDNAQCIYETLPPHMLTVMILVKIFTYQFNSRKIKDLTDRLFVDWDMLETVEEHNIMRKYAQNGRWYALIYGSYVYVSTISFTTTSLVPRILDIVFPLNTSRPVMLAYPAYYFVDENQYFYYIFLHMLITSSMCMTGLIAHDSMFFIYVEHICGLFAVVGFRFENVSHKRNNTEKNLIDCLDDGYHRNVVFSIHAHRKVLRFAKLLEDTFSISFAVQLLIVTIGLSITLVQLSMQLHDLAEAMRYFVFIIAQLFHLFCLSFQGQKLISHSLETCDKIFRGSWFTIPVKEQRLLMFVMRKSIEANVLTAGKIYVFSLENFTAVVQSSMSYFTLLSSFDMS